MTGVHERPQLLIVGLPLGAAHDLWRAGNGQLQDERIASLVLAVPGAERSPLLRRSTIALVARWAITLLAAIVHAGHGFTAVADWPACFLRVMARSA